MGTKQFCLSSSSLSAKRSNTLVWLNFHALSALSAAFLNSFFVLHFILQEYWKFQEHLTLSHSPMHVYILFYLPKISFNDLPEELQQDPTQMFTSLQYTP